MRRPPRPPYWRGAAWVQAQPAGLSPLSSALAASAACGRTSPLLCAAIWRRSFLWEVGTSYNERRLLWGAVRFVQAVSCVRRTPPVRAEKGAGSACPAPAALARRGRACGFNPPGSACGGRNFKGRGKKSAFGRQKGGRGGGRRLILDLDNTIRQGRGGYFDHTAHQAVRRRI